MLATQANAPTPEPPRTDRGGLRNGAPGRPLLPMGASCQRQGPGRIGRVWSEHVGNTPAHKDKPMTVAPAEELQARRTALQGKLEEQGLAGAIVQQSRNLLYLVGMAGHGHLVIPSRGEPTLVAHLDVDRARQAAALDDVRAGRGVRTVVEVLDEHGLTGKKLGAELQSVPYARIDQLCCAAELPVPDDVSDPLLQLRAVKSSYELQQLREAAACSDELFETLALLAHPGMTECELHGRLSLEARRLGGDGLVAKRGWNDRTVEHGWVVSGHDTGKVSGYWLTMTGQGPSMGRPYGPSQRTLEDGDLLVYDVGMAVNGYHSDQARTYVLGTPSSRQHELLAQVEELKRAALLAVGPDAHPGEPYEAARRVAEAEGLAGVFMTEALHPFPYIGHGVGVEIDEPPLLSPKTNGRLRPGMVLAVEPKLMIPGWGGITSEDTVVVTEDGCEALTGAAWQGLLPASNGPEGTRE